MTNLQRNTIIRLMIKRIELLPDNRYCDGLCSIYYTVRTETNLGDLLPELAEVFFNRRFEWDYGYFTWPTNKAGDNDRIKFLESCLVPE